MAAPLVRSMPRRRIVVTIRSKPHVRPADPLRGQGRNSRQHSTSPRVHPCADSGPVRLHGRQLRRQRRLQRTGRPPSRRDPPVPRLLGRPPEVHHTGRSVGTSTTVPASSRQVSGWGTPTDFCRVPSPGRPTERHQSRGDGPETASRIRAIVQGRRMRTGRYFRL